MRGAIARIVKRNGTRVPYDADRIAMAVFKAAASIHKGNRSEAERLAALVEQHLLEMYGGHAPTVEDIQDVVETVLLDEDHPFVARAYISYRRRRALLRESREEQLHATFNNIPYRKIYDVLCWNLDHGCESVEALNALMAGGGMPGLVEACEARYARECYAAAERVLNRIEEMRVVIVAGPSSSGKTTTTIKMAETLEAEGCRLKAINIDHYFFSLENHPRDEFGDYDYETPQALDLELINRHLGRLLAGETIHMPNYDFRTGKRTLGVHEMSLAPNEILLIDSLHGLYEPMTESVPSENKFRLYIETLGQLRNKNGQFMRWADHRLMRRMIRDSWHRNHQPADTITHWHYVRKSELQHIIPFIGSVDYIVNSAMPYEIPILKHKLFQCFPAAMEQFQADPHRQDAYIRAKRVAEFLEPLSAIEDDGIVPARSLLREFIGGSEYTY